MEALATSIAAFYRFLFLSFSRSNNHVYSGRSAKCIPLSVFLSRRTRRDTTGSDDRDNRFFRVMRSLHHLGKSLKLQLSRSFKPAFRSKETWPPNPSSHVPG